MKDINNINVAYAWNNDKFIQIIKKRMSDLNMTQRELAKKVGVTPVSMSRYFSKERNPRKEITYKIFDILDLSYADVMYEIDPSIPVSRYARSKLIEILNGLSDEEQFELITVMECWANYKKSK